jgi:hypothetical protein
MQFILLKMDGFAIYVWRYLLFELHYLATLEKVYV